MFKLCYFYFLFRSSPYRSFGPTPYNYSRFWCSLLDWRTIGLPWSYLALILINASAKHLTLIFSTSSSFSPSRPPPHPSPRLRPEYPPFFHFSAFSNPPFYLFIAQPGPPSANEGIDALICHPEEKGLRFFYVHFCTSKYMKRIRVFILGLILLVLFSFLFVHSIYIFLRTNISYLII